METNVRATGRTTRIIDEAIQHLFNTGSVTVIDHEDIRENNMSVMFKLCARLKAEHPQVKFKRQGLHITLL